MTERELLTQIVDAWDNWQAALRGEYHEPRNVPALMEAARSLLARPTGDPVADRINAAADQIERETAEWSRQFNKKLERSFTSEDECGRTQSDGSPS